MSKEGGNKAKYKHQECKRCNFHAALQHLPTHSLFLPLSREPQQNLLYPVFFSYHFKTEEGNF